MNIDISIRYLLCGFMAGAPIRAHAAKIDTVVVEQTADTDTGRSLLLIRSKKDTVLLVKNGDVESIIKNIGEGIHKSRIQGYGGAGGPTPGLLLTDMGPVKDVIDFYPDIRNKNLDVGRFEFMIASGGLGYGGIGNGLRIGGGGFGGNLQFSVPYTNNGNDSIAVLDVGYGFGGLLIEKVLVRDRWNIIVGGMTGGGHYDLSYNTVDRDNISISANGTTSNSGIIRGGFLGLYSGFTYTLVPWFHLGADGGLNTFIGTSTEGRLLIVTRKNNFFSFTPHLRIRFIFGNLG